MSKFIKYENLDFRINNDIFYSTSIQISLKTNIEPVLLSDGSLLRYAPQGTVVGSLITEFFLTGDYPSYLIPTSSSENPVNALFAGVQIENCYLKTVSFKASQFSPISLSAEFDWFGKLNTVDSTNNLKQFYFNRNQPLGNISHSNRSYISDLSNVFGFSEIFGFQYSEQCERIPFFKNGETVPFRVAKSNKNKSVNVDGNFFKQNNVSDVEGKITNCDLYIKDYNNNLLNTFNISGRIESRGMNAANNGILQSTLAITQRLAPLRNTL